MVNLRSGKKQLNKFLNLRKMGKMNFMENKAKIGLIMKKVSKVVSIQHLWLASFNCPQRNSIFR